MAEFNYGGQAVMEGVMMRGSKTMAVAVRAPNGRIVVHSEPLNPTIYRGWMSRVPVVRGMTMLWDALVLGTRTLMFSADIAAGTVPQPAQGAPSPPLVSERGQGAAAEAETPERASRSIFSDPVAWGTVALSLGLAVGIFFLLPALLTRWLDRYIANALISNLVEGFIRLSFIIAYVWGVGFLPDVRRVFAFHGAEHKTVHAYEAGEPLTVDTVQAHTTAHARCGTAFILVVVVISVLVFSLLGRPPLLLRLVSRILLLPLIAGIAYEWLKFSARHESKWWMRGFLWPGLFMQRLTTREPDDDMIEVAIAALKRVLQEDGLPVPDERVPVAV